MSWRAGWLLFLLGWHVARGGAPAFPGYSSQIMENLALGETCRFTLRNGTARSIELVSVNEHRDTVFGRVRTADVAVRIDGRELILPCAPYVMPTVCDGLRIQADTTTGFQPGLPKRVQFSLWDAADPIVDTSKFRFPLPDYEWLSQGMQTHNEVCWLGERDDLVAGSRYHNYGIDFAGDDGADEVRSPVSGTVLGVWSEMPAAWDRGSVVVADNVGLWWELAHLDRAVAGLAKGRPLEAGDPVGWLGRRGPSGGFPHLHVGAYFAAGPKKWNVNDRLNLYPWFVAAYQARYAKNLYAIAGEHQLLRVGETAWFDATRSLSFDSSIISFRWVFSDGTESRKARAEKSFSAPGVYSAALWVEDRTGRRDVAFCEVRVFPPGPPAAPPRIRLTCHPSLGAAAGTPVRFRLWTQGMASAPVSIDFGDGTAPVRLMPPVETTHTYAVPGLHVVTARSTDESLIMVRQIKLIIGPTGP